LSSLLENAVEAISVFCYGMDTSDWSLATSRVAESVDLDYSQVGLTKATMSNSEVRSFLVRLLGKPELRVHTAISQVLRNPSDDSEFIAYCSVKHFKGALGQARTFFIYGWYTFRLEAGKISTFAINVQAIEGDATVLK
jgi:hypothetical protein